MDIYYMNDEEQDVLVQVNGQLLVDQEKHGHPHGEPQIDYYTLKPCEAKVFTVDAPEGTIPYIKRWERRHVLLTYVHPEAIDPSRRT